MKTHECPAAKAEEQLEIGRSEYYGLEGRAPTLCLWVHADAPLDFSVRKLCLVARSLVRKDICLVSLKIIVTTKTKRWRRIRLKSSKITKKRKIVAFFP